MWFTRHLQPPKTYLNASNEVANTPIVGELTHIPQQSFQLSRPSGFPPGWTGRPQSRQSHPYPRLVLATGPCNAPAVRVWTAKTGWFGSRPVQQPDPLTLGGPNPDTYPSTREFRRVWPAPSVSISGSAFRVSHLWSHSDMLLLIVKY